MPSFLRVKHSSFWTGSPLKMKAIHPFETSGPHCIQKTLNAQYLRRENPSGGDHKPWGFTPVVALPDMLSKLLASQDRLQAKVKQSLYRPG